MSLLDTVKELVKVSARVLNLGNKVDELATLTREEVKALWEASANKDLRIRDLENRVQKMENFFEFSEKMGLFKLPKSGDKD